ncbi:MAG: 16S rRNA (guanine(966)-N(2))-methyltransferase RsmD [Ruminococcaceae bacterium]|nr:16S rRNA (guanine(966)-N(2))-methyltransferase RsmD [Oscillospiraceae bacterium]
MMRIITGKARGVKLKTLEGDATRPTSERSKEALFSMLQFDIEGREVLDLFAGSGQLGLEALSRGAAAATFVDKSKQATKIIDENVIKTKLLDGARVICSDVTDFVRTVRGRNKYDIVFIDPPYAQQIAVQTAKSLYDARLLKPTSIVCCESSEQDIFATCPDAAQIFAVIKQKKFGISYITLLGLKGEDEQ